MYLKFFEKKTSTQDLIWETRRIWQGDIKNGDIYSGLKLQKNIYQANVHQKQPKVRPKARGKDDAENDRRVMAIVTWRQVVQDRDG